jgi:hypothetical protein
MLAIAMALGSLVALVPALLYSVLILWRLQQEDRFLKGNLPAAPHAADRTTRSALQYRKNLFF